MKKIFLDLCGGIGNQLFEFCFAKELADRLGYEVLTNRKRFYRRNDNHGEFLLDYIYFDDGKKYCSNNIFMSLYVGIKWKAMYINDKFFKIQDNKHTFLEKAQKGYIYTLKTEQIIDNIDDIIIKRSVFPIMEGYYQWPRIMPNTIEWLKNNIKFKCLCDARYDELKKLIICSNSVAVHVRRGDYIGLKHLQVCDYNYYINAINFVKKKVEEPSFFIFSDDIEWVKNNYMIEGTYIVPSDASTNDLYLMSLCKHFVISNSTFSWWGQELSNNNDKIVVAPNIWFNNNDSTELYMDYFEKVKTGELYEY